MTPPPSPAALAAAYGEMGKLFIAAEYYDAAEACFGNAGELAPVDMRWPYYLGHAYRRGNQNDAGRDALRRALTLQPDHVPSLVWLAEMHLASNQPDDAAAAAREGAGARAAAAPCCTVSAASRSRSRTTPAR